MWRGTKPGEVSDGWWEGIEPLLPARERRFRYPGRKPLDDRAVLQGILFVLHTGIGWEHLPQELGFGCGMTAWAAAEVAAGGCVGAAARAAVGRTSRGRPARVGAGAR